MPVIPIIFRDTYRWASSFFYVVWAAVLVVGRFLALPFPH
jgi:hypothetical protein